MSIRKELVKIGKMIEAKGLIVGPGGNISAREGNIVYMKASGVAMEEATEEDYVAVDIRTGKIVDGKKKPSCELNMHFGCYKVRPEISAVVHTHPAYATAYSMTGKTMKPFTPDFVAVVMSDVPCIKYVVPAGNELAEEVSAVIKRYNAVFMGNHGLLTIGHNLKEAYYRTLLLEDACKTIAAAKLFGKMKYFSSADAKTVDNLEAEAYRRKLLKKK